MNDDLLKDPDWRLDHLYYIINKDKKKVLFRKNAVQQQIHDRSGRFSATLKARQMGVSTYWLLKYLDIACFTPNVTVAILSHDRESLAKLFKIIRNAHKFMHPDVQPVVDKGGGSKYRLYFPQINSEIYCTLEAVSDAVSHLHVSEMALMNNDDRVLTSIDAVPITSGQISIETTARGFNHFHDFWVQPNAYKKLFFPWYVHDEYQIETDKLKFTDDEIKLVKKAKKLFNIDITDEQIAFRRFKISQKKGNVQDFLQEYPEDDQTCFITSGESIFDGHELSKLITDAPEPIHTEKNIKIYKEVDKSKAYVCGVDVAEGVNGDYSVAVMMDPTNFEVVAVYRTNEQGVSDFSESLNDFCKLYQRSSSPLPLLAIERNNHGHSVILKMDEIKNYSNQYQDPNDQKYGWKTNNVSRPIMMDAFVDAVKDSMITLNDIDILSECLTLVNNGGKIEAVEGKHDDTIIACAIAIQMCINAKELFIYHDIENRILL